MNSEKPWGLAALPVVILGIVVFAVPAFFRQATGYVFLGSMALLITEFVVIGFLLKGRAEGAFIDNRNMLSLSKLQAGAWTVVVLAGFVSAASFNATLSHVNYGIVSSLSVTLPGELLLAMGISATSLVATPSLLSLKAAEEPKGGTAAAAVAATGRIQGTAIGNGKVLTKESDKDASWADIFTGDELGNAGIADLGKIQQVLISVLLIGAYAAYIFQYFSTATSAITTLPTLDKSFVWLLGLSHASYLAYKAAPHTSSADNG